jgi:uncharacterized protein (TIGR00269 family)
MSLRCSYCGNEAFYSQPYSGNAFCQRCYPEALEKRVRDNINHNRLLKPDDRIAIAVSGGKDSVSLLHILARIEDGFKRTELVAVSIDEGIEGYRNEALNIAAENSSMLCVEHRILSFKSLFGHTIDEIVGVIQKKGQFSVCAYCGILRRKALNVAAKNAHASVLATAHNLDDETQSILMSLMRGNVRLLNRKSEVLGGFVRRIKPLCLIPEREIVLYAYLKHIPFQSVPCPYANTSLRNDVREFLDVVDEKHPGMKFNLSSAINRLQLAKHNESSELRACQSCGEPSSGPLCRSCQVLQDLGICG